MYGLIASGYYYVNDHSPLVQHRLALNLLSICADDLCIDSFDARDQNIFIPRDIYFTSNIPVTLIKQKQN